MISFQDCLDMCGLTLEEVRALAEHEHISDIEATALADYLLHLPHGRDQVQRMIEEDIRAALERGDHVHARELFTALRHFLSEQAELAEETP